MELEFFIRSIFQNYKKEKITFIGLGNPYRSDDGFGLEFIKKVKDKFINSFTEFDNIDEVILNLCNDKSHGLVIFVDSSDFNGEPGELRVISYNEIEDVGKHFHKIPMKLYMKLLQKENKQTYLIAVQPQTIEHQENCFLSSPVLNSINQLLAMIENFPE
jgi:hydrogenase 3 maturation protease